MVLAENDIIKNLARFFEKLPQDLVGIGDDAAVMPTGGAERYIISKDLLVENIHFRLKYFSAEDLAHKSLHVNLSDIAAMGAKPEFVLLGLALPSTLNAEWVKRFSESFTEQCKVQDVLLVGGDTTASERDLFISVTVIGRAEGKHIKYRDGAKTGDIICVAGMLGEAGAGLSVLEKGLDGFEVLKAKTLCPVALVKEGQWLGLQPGITAMMDISDGLYTDLGRMMEKSGVGAMVELRNLKPSNLLGQFCATQGMDEAEFMLVGGEDYALLFTVKANMFAELARDFRKTFGYALQKIGIVGAGKDVKLMRNDAEVLLQYKAFAHFGEH